MAIDDNAVRDMEKNKFIEDAKRPGQPAIAVDVANITEIGVGKKNTSITNFSLAVKNVEYAHVLIANIKELIVRNRTLSDLKISFVVNESATKYITVKSGTVMVLDDLDFTGKTLYMQSEKISLVEIMELY